jgi:hypothetical protein
MKALGKGSIASWVRMGLAIAWWALWACAVGLVLIAIAYGVVTILDPNWAAQGDGHLTFGGEGRGSLDVTFDDPGGWIWPVFVPALIIGGVAVAGSLMIVWRLRKLFDSFSSGEPFRRENANHLRAIWVIMIAIEIARYVLLGVTGALIAAYAGPNVHAEYEFSIDLSTWGSILILIVLAEVFREGARLKEEQELTI